MNILSKILRIGEGKTIKNIQNLVDYINSLEVNINKLSDEQLVFKSNEFKSRFKRGESLDDLLPETFAVVREIAKRTINMRHFDVQIFGGIILHQGKIAEMATGEGKTLVATLPVCLNSLENKGVSIVTVNDYLAKRDANWMGPIYKKFGLNIGLLQNEMGVGERKEAYNSDVIYGTNNEFGFDYLRDNMIFSANNQVQRGHYYAIVDEVDSILIDEARTPLIISGAPYESAKIYYTFAKLTPGLKRNVDYEVSEKERSVFVTENGVKRVEKMLKIDNLYDPKNAILIHHLNQALKALILFKRDVDYLVKNGEVVIIDEFTGRLMPGRRYSEGLHQAIEAKEGVKIKQEHQTLATITIQNYFRIYEKLAGMTGTAATEAEEFRKIYSLEVVVIPPNKPLNRNNLPDLIYKNEEIKFKNVIKDISKRHEIGQPVLVGTRSVEKSEYLSNMLKRKGIKHEVLNAKYHEREAEIVAKAGQMGAVTIATNMAGRGTDIVLGEGITKIGGLHILGTERHEARRIDNQLRGRSGRQGDPGSSQFYLSLDDELMRLFGSERIGKVMERFNFPDYEPITHQLVTKSVEIAQKEIESVHFDMRKRVLEYDDVLNKQREVIYNQRSNILKQENITENIKNMIEDVVEKEMKTLSLEEIKSYQGDKSIINSFLIRLLPPENYTNFTILDINKKVELENYLKEYLLNKYKSKEREVGIEQMRSLERYILLNVMDYHWREHLRDMDDLRDGIGLHAYAQRDPLIEYQHESYSMFEQMIDEMKEDVLRVLFHAKKVEKKEEDREASKERILIKNKKVKTKRIAAKYKKIGRNDPCPCGSGKKYKLCCGA
ncbi:MAG: preprotein translocase subunit SecA [Actinobacteria bacterium]|nr:preprotein translocase subunit SecA [Actinomycetota bacterium]